MRDGLSWLEARGKLLAVLGLSRMETLIRSLRICWEEQGQDIAEYAVMLAVILVIVVGTIKLIGTNANSTFSNFGSSLQ